MNVAINISLELPHAPDKTPIFASTHISRLSNAIMTVMIAFNGIGYDTTVAVEMETQDTLRDLVRKAL
jgi:hypothetical protein